MINVLFVTPVTEDRKQEFENMDGFSFVFKAAADVTEDDVKEADAILGNLPLSMIEKASNLKWIQLNSAGANTYKDIRSDIILTNASGAYGEAISEHMLGCVLMVLKNLARYLEMQKSHDWENLGSVNTLSITKVLSVGMGDIGTSFAKKMNALGAEVCGVRRSIHDKPDYVKELYTMEDLDRILPEFDVVALSLPETEETVHLFDAKKLSLMKEGSILVNVGRGDFIDCNALNAVLDEGLLRGAALDVTDPEPLPLKHSLWRNSRCLITPHVAGGAFGKSDKTEDIIAAICCDNLRRYVAGEELTHRVF